jgi:hypothetical protein
MRQFPNDDPRLGRSASDPFDPLEQARIERLLRGARDAALFSHKLALLDAEAKHRLALYHSHFNPNQPRVPAGHPDGGQWTSEGGGRPGNEQQVMSDVASDNDWQPGAQYAAKRRGRGSGSDMEGGQAARLVAANARAQDAIGKVREIEPNWRPRGESLYGTDIESQIRRANDLADEAEARIRELASFELPPLVPKRKPDTSKERNDIAREIAKWMDRNYGRATERATWLRDYEAEINAYLDPPKSLEELQQAAASGSRPGYQIHHIVEQKSARDDKFPEAMIDAPENLVRIPTYRHQEINGWFGRLNKDFGLTPPREYLRGKGWDERLKLGIRALIEHGVLKP